MSFFRTLLEDEVNILPGNNDGSAEARELMDEIDNAEINEDEIEDAREGEFSPDGEDIVDEMYMAIAESEMEWNEFMQEAGLKELAATASGSPINEGFDDVKAWFAKAKEKIKEFFKKVWQVIQRWASNITSVLVTNKKFVEKYRSKIEAGAKKYLSDSRIDRIKGYTFSGLEPAYKELIDTGDEAKQLIELSKYISNKDEVGSVNHDDVEHIRDMSEEMRSMFKKVLNSSDISRDAFTKVIRGSKDKVDLKLSAKEVCDILSDKEMTKKKLNKAFSESKKEFKNAISVIDKAEKNARKQKEPDHAYMNLCSSVNNLLNEFLKYMQIARSAVLSGISARKRQARHVGNIYVRLANKGEYKGFQNESYGFLSSANLI